MPRPSRIASILQMVFYAVVIRPLTFIVIGFNARNAGRLRYRGAHIVAANHNSHLDALVLMSLFPLSTLRRVKAVGARDYFCRTRLTAWFSTRILGIVPIDRSGGADAPLQPLFDALDADCTIILFPEGSRGEPERAGRLRYGVAHVVEARPSVAVTPIYLYGLGKALPRGEGLLVPFVCDLNVGEPIAWRGARKTLMSDMQTAFDDLKAEMAVKPWL